MGILVFIVMFGTRTSDNALLIFRAEMPGPDVGKLLPKASETARILYRIYLALTLLEIVLLVLGGSPLFDSVVHAMGTAGTGGFGIRSDSIGDRRIHKEKAEVRRGRKKNQRILRTILHCLGFRSVTGTVMLIALPPAERIP